MKLLSLKKRFTIMICFYNFVTSFVSVNNFVSCFIRFIEKLSPEISSSYSGLSSSVVKSANEEFLSGLTFYPIGSLNSIDTVKFVVIVGTIKSFASNNEWFYNACTSCNKKVSTISVVKEKQEGTDGFEEVTILECKTDVCNTRTVSSIPRIRLSIRVQDCTGIVTLTLFEREVTKLLKVNANQLLDNNIELANEGNFPKELNVLLNMKFAFKIVVSSFNTSKKSDGYSVSKMTDNPLVCPSLINILIIFSLLMRKPSMSHHPIQIVMSIGLLRILYPKREMM
ncbi:putative nucleic acid-binding, replication factor A [Helianthus annuus]|nr:putative nucleic acid-binding, replication factor A [Helianthus annuus]